MTLINFAARPNVRCYENVFPTACMPALHNSNNVKPNTHDFNAAVIVVFVASLGLVQYL